jgi:hypothetical protein
MSVPSYPEKIGRYVSLSWGEVPSNWQINSVQICGDLLKKIHKPMKKMQGCKKSAYKILKNHLINAFSPNWCVDCLYPIC